MGGSKSQTVGYFYYKDLQGVICHAPVDAITRIECSDRQIHREEITQSGITKVNAENIFGGKDREGGISGDFEFQFGDENQEPSAYLVQKLGEYVPASRGVLSVVFRNVYQGMNPYFRDYLYTVVRTSTGWYDEKSRINEQGDDGVYVNKQWRITTSVDGVVISVTTVASKSITRDSGLISIELTTSSAENFIFETGQSNHILTRGVEDLVFKSSNSLNVEAIDNTGYWKKQYKLSAIIKKGINVKTVINITYKRKPNFYGPEIQLYFKAPSPVSGYLQRGYHEADINPAHIIRDCLTNKRYGLGVDESLIDDVAFKKCADKLFDEGLGMSIVWAQTTSIWEFIREVCDHVQAVMPHEDVNTGKWTWALLRDDYVVESLLHLDESNIEKIKSYKRKTMADMVNIVTVSYTDRDQGKVSSITVDNPARVAQQGKPIETKVEYLGFSNSEVAGRVALRDLKTLSKELASVSFIALSVVKNLKVGDCFTWSWGDYGISRSVMRVNSIKRAGILSSKYIIDAIEDSFSTPMESVIPYVPPTPSNNENAEPSEAIAIEAPYYEVVQQQGQAAIDTALQISPDGGFVMVAAHTNQNAMNATLLTSLGGAFEDVGVIDFCEIAKNISTISKTDQSFVIDSLIEVQEESYFKVNDELMSVVSFDLSTRLLTVKRGVLDTQVKDHAAQSTLWFMDLNYGFDEQMYFEGQEVDAKALTNTGTDVLLEDEAETLTVEMQARAFRPYPPQNVKINGDYFPGEIETDLIVTWSDRNRLSQTAGTFVSWFDESVTIEPNTQTWIIVTEYGENDVELATNNANVTGATTYTKAISTLQPDTRYMNITLKTLRDNYECLMPFSYDVALSTFFSAPYNIVAEFKND